MKRLKVFGIHNLVKSILFPKKILKLTNFCIHPKQLKQVYKFSLANIILRITPKFRFKTNGKARGYHLTLRLWKINPNCGWGVERSLKKTYTCVCSCSGKRWDYLLRIIWEFNRTNNNKQSGNTLTSVCLSLMFMCATHEPLYSRHLIAVTVAGS